MKLVRLAAVASLVAFATCTLGSSGPPTLEVSVDKSQLVNDGEFARVGIVAVANGDYGTGKVTLSSDFGSLKAGDTKELDGLGLAEWNVTCDVSKDPDCVDTMTLTAKWTPSGGKQLTQTANLKVVAPPIVGTRVYQSSVDPLCAADAGRTVEYPDAGPLMPDDVPASCHNGFEVNNARGVYVVHASTAAGSRFLTLDVDLATYRAPDAVRITGTNSAGAYTLVDTCRLQTATEVDPTMGMARPPDDTIRQFRVDLQPGTSQLTFDFSQVTSPMYLRVIGLCDFTVQQYSNCSRWAAVQ